MFSKFIHIAVVTLLISLGFCSTTYAQGNKLSAGLRQHAVHPELDQLPLGKDDISYGIAYELHEAKQPAYWQFALYYANDVSGTNSAGMMDLDYVMTPNISLMVAENAWRTGLGVSKSYVRDEQGGLWTDVYWQFTLGLNFPLGSMPLDICAYYVFEDIGDVLDVDFDHLDIGFWLSYKY